MLHFGMKIPFSFEKFISMCYGPISESDIEILKTASAIDEYDYKKPPPIIRKWRTFDRSLRNELVKIRATRKKLDPNKSMRGDEYTDPSIAHVALHACRTPSSLEAEKILDQERWRYLDELAMGHYFDIDALIIYAIKLLILERWERIRTLDKTRVLDEMFEIADSG